MPDSSAIVELVGQWVADAASDPEPAAAELEAMLRDPDGLPFTVGFIDRVIRPEDPRVAAQALAALAKRQPEFVPVPLRAALLAGSVTSRLAPAQVARVARRTLASRVSHLVLDARASRLGPAIARLRADGTKLNLNLLGEAVLGPAEADRRLQRTAELLARDDVDYVSVKVSSMVAPRAPWAFEETVSEVCERLAPLFATRKFINLDMEEYRDLDLTVSVFKTLLERPELLRARAGIVLQAYLPDAFGAMTSLQEWATARVAAGGAPVKVRVVKGANLPMERVDAALHGWPLATWASKRETDASYKRILSYAMTPGRVRAVELGVAGHNLFDVAYAWLLAGEREVRGEVDFEMLLGMAGADARVVARTVGPLRLYTPVVHPGEFDVAISYLVRRLEEGATEENFLSAAADLGHRPELFERERERFLAALSDVQSSARDPRELSASNRADPDASCRDGTGGFSNAADTDPSVARSRAWAYGILRRVPASTLGAQTVAFATVTDPAVLDSMIAEAGHAGLVWGQTDDVERAELLRRAATELERRRGDLIEVMAAECGKTLDQGDPEVSEAVDFANYYASLAGELEAVDGASPIPVLLTLVAPPWNFPVSIPAGCVLGALAAGSAVMLKPAPEAMRCAAVLAEVLWAAGIPRSALRLVCIDEDELGRQLVSDSRIGQVLLTGGYETAQLFRSWRPDLPLLAETSGKNAIVVTPSADFELAVRDIVASAFGNTGQKCSAASLAILVGSVGNSDRFQRQLFDATRSLKVGWPADPRTQVGPLIAPPTGKLERALAKLEAGESWIVTPRALDDSGRLWSPGLRAGVRPGSWFHVNECFGPVLGLITVNDLDEALAVQNSVPYGLTAGLHSLNREEIAGWLSRVQAGNLYVNRGITGAIVRRQPFGGWKRSAVGPGFKAGGPSYLLGLCDWASKPSVASDPLGPLAGRIVEAAGSAGLDASTLERCLRSDTAALASHYGPGKDVSELGVELNVLRYLPVRGDMVIRAETDATSELWRLVRVSAAAALCGAQVTVSVSSGLPEALSQLLAGFGFPVVVESLRGWLSRLHGEPVERLRYVCGDEGAPFELWTAVGDRIDLTVFGSPVTESGRLELLPFLREQTVSITAHRFGTPDRTVAGLI